MRQASSIKRPARRYVVALLLLLPVAVLSLPAEAFGEPLTCPASLDPSVPLVWEPPTAKPLDVKATPVRVTISTVIGAAKNATESVYVYFKLNGTGTSRELSGKSGLIEGQIPPGRYTVWAQNKGGSRSSPPQIVNVHGDKKALTLYLGTPKLLYYRMNGIAVPFTPQADLIAIVFEYNVPPLAKTEQIVRDLKSKLKIVPVPQPGLPAGRLTWGDGSAMIFRLQHNQSRDQVVEKIRDEMKRPARIGTPIDFGNGSGRLRILDNHFVIGTQAKAKVLQSTVWPTLGVTAKWPIDPDNGVFGVELAGTNYEKHLAAVNCLFEAGLISLGEPDLIFELVDQELPTGYPNDPLFATSQDGLSNNLGRQHVKGAWKLLTDWSNPSQIGDSQVVVGVLDKGIDPNYAEFSCPASDASPQFLCWDARTSSTCNVTPPSDDERQYMNHGMGVFGIIGACNHNSLQIAGIAPGVHNISVTRTQYTSSEVYANILRWLGGVDTPCPSGDHSGHPCTWPRLVRSAQVINCSHSLSQAVNEDPGCLAQVQIGHPEACSQSVFTALPALIGIAFQKLKIARDGRGVILVYAAGNNGQATLDFEPLAADPRTIAVANCMFDIATGDERLTRNCISGSGCDDTSTGGSNYGPGIDLCALGKGSQTVNHACFSSGTAPAECKLGGTSAAAATVSGAVALMLSANPKLYLWEVKEILRVHSRRIDEANGLWDRGMSPIYGAGRLDVCRAVSKSLALSGRVPYGQRQQLLDSCQE